MYLFKRYITQLPDYKTKRKIVVFESDDWGSIRMPSKDVFNICIKKGYQVDKNIYTMYDSLASEQDLFFLFNVLKEFKDFKGNCPIITANCLVANPDFNKIKESDFIKYYPEPIDTTFKKYPAHSNNLKIWEKARNENIFFPQSHGREHLNVSRFMNNLKIGNIDAMFAFNLEMPGIFPRQQVNAGNEYVVALEYFSEEDKQKKIQITREALEIFYELFGYHSLSFIASNYVWPIELEKEIHKKKVKFIQGARFQLLPKGNFKGFKKRYHFTGQKNQNNQIYLVRNAHFEPSSNPNKDWIDLCLRDIENAFKRNNAAIICSHRVNFVGFIDPQNRERNLKLFRRLLKEILKKWPMVEFINTVELGSLLLNESN